MAEYSLLVGLRRLGRRRRRHPCSDLAVLPCSATAPRSLQMMKKPSSHSFVARGPGDDRWHSSLPASVVRCSRIQFGIVFNNYLTLTDATRAGARKAAVSRFIGDNGASAIAAVKTAASSLDQSTLVPTVLHDAGGATDWSTPGTSSRSPLPTRTASTSSVSASSPGTSPRRPRSDWNEEPAQ